MAPRNPMGTPKTVASKSNLALPRIALAMPPPDSPTGAGQGQENRAKNACAGKGNDHFPCGFPARGPEREGGFALVARDGEKHFTGDGNDIGDDHNGEDNARGQKADAVGRALK